MTNFTGILAAAALLLSQPAFAQLEAWRAMSEEDLHSRSVASFGGRVGELFAPCDKAGKLTVARPYSKDYDLSKGDLAAFEKGMNSVKRYSNIQAALKDGYLPVTRGFVPSVGLMMAHPGLIRDGAYNLDKPDIITYIKKKGQPQFRLVGLVYVAGTKEPGPIMGVTFGPKSRKKDAQSKASTQTWDYEDGICVIVEPGKSVGIYPPSETPFNCKDGAMFTRMWRLYTWPMVYNPNGMFSEVNPMVDFLDRQQTFGPLCQKSK